MVWFWFEHHASSPYGQLLDMIRYVRLLIVVFKFFSPFVFGVYVRRCLQILWQPLVGHHEEKVGNSIHAANQPAVFSFIFRFSNANWHNIFL
jgi:hypothetical protein